MSKEEDKQPKEEATQTVQSDDASDKVSKEEE